MRLLLAALLALPAAAPALGFKPLIDASAAYEYSAMGGAQGSHGAPMSLLAVPMFSFGKADLLAPILFFDYKQRERPLPEEGEPFLQRSTFLFKPTWKRKFDGFDLSLSGQAKRTVSMQFSEPWSKGLYDFEEFGFGAKAALGWKPPLTEKLELGASWSAKGYPNYRSPLASGAKNYYVKDQQGTRLELKAGFKPWGRLSSSLGYALSLRAYSDAFVYRKDLQIDPELRRFDMLHSLDLGASLPLSQAWVLGLGLAAQLNASNYHDIDPQALRWIENPQSFHSVALRPSLTWLLQGKPEGHSLALGAQLLNRAYAAKPIRTPQGAYTQGVQADFEQDYSLKGTYVWAYGLSFFGLGSASFAQSNQGFQNTVKFSYELYALQAGLEYRL